VSGVLLVLYLCLHLAVLSRLADPAAYTTVVRLAAHPLVQALEIALLGLLLAHGLNGLRVTLLELGLPTRLHRTALGVAIVLWAALMAATCVYTLGGPA
jgi:succinate dehydrogenase / fumarate reductase cytochrome b subunit